MIPFYPSGLKYYILFFYVVFVSTSSILFAQQANNSADSLRKVYNEADNLIKIDILIALSKVVYDSSSIKAIEIAKEAVVTAGKQKEIERLSNAHENLGKLYQQDENFNDAIQHYDSVVQIQEELGSFDGRFQLHTSIARLYRKLGNYEKAVENDLKALEIAESYNDSADIALSLNNLGISYYRLGNFNNAMSYYEQSLESRTQLGDSSGMADSYNNLAMIFDDQKEFDKALDYYNKALLIFDKLGIKSGVADSYNNMAGTYYHMGDFDKVIEYALLSFKIREELGHKWEIAFTLINIGILSKSRGNYVDAIQFLKKGLDKADETGTLSLASLAYLHLAESYTLINNYKKAYEYEQLYASVQDSIFREESANAIAEMQTKYETEKKEKEIELLNKEKEVQGLQLKKSENQRIFFIVVAILVLVLSILIYSRYRLKSRTNKLLAEKNKQLEILNATKDKFFTIIAHDIKNPLSGFRSISQSLSDSLFDISKEEIHYFIKELNQSSNMLYDLLQNLLQWAKSQTDGIKYEPEILDVKEIVESNFNLLKNNADKKKIELLVKLDLKANAFADKNAVFTIMRNLVSNAIKFTPEGGKVFVKSEIKENRSVISVIDNGIGISQEDQLKLFRIDVDTASIGLSEEKGTGLGLILCKELTEKNKGKIWVESTPDKGSTFSFSLPLKSN